MSAPGNKPAAKPTARVAFCGGDATTTAVLRDAFRQFSIETSLLADPLAQLQKEKFEGVVVALEPGAEKLLEALRTSKSNHRVVVYGIAGSTREALQFSRFGINAMVIIPVDRASAIKTVRSTRTLLMHEFRRYVRLPVVTAVELRLEGKPVTAPSIEISAGGMCLATDFLFKRGERVMAKFTLPGAEEVTMPAEICWAKPADKEIGIRFEHDDPNRAHVRRWIDDYLEFS